MPPKSKPGLELGTTCGIYLFFFTVVQHMHRDEFQPTFEVNIVQGRPRYAFAKRSISGDGPSSRYPSFIRL